MKKYNLVCDYTKGNDGEEWPMIRHLELKAYGKINLGTDVVRRREDGYHEVRMIMQTVRVRRDRTEPDGGRGNPSFNEPLLSARQ